jgi:putative hemolysin
MASPEPSYAHPQDPFLKRALIRAIEDLLGRRRLLPVYRRWQHESIGSPSTMWNSLLDRIGIRLDIATSQDLTESVPQSPLVIVANHPFGIADGIALLALAERLGRPYRILLNAGFMRLPEMQALGLPIDFSDSDEALATNLKTRAEARRLLKEGVTIIIFPAGGVATAENPFGKAEELPWKLFAARLIQQSDASVLPVYFEGQNSNFFHFASRYSLTLRLALLISEFKRTMGSAIRVHIGAPIQRAEIAAVRTAGLLCDELYLRVHSLAPGAEAYERSVLLPRPADQRRRFPWDPPARTGPYEPARVASQP